MSVGKKVVEGFDILFKDDFSIVDSEISRKLALPKPYILNPNEMLIIYDDSLFKLSNTPSNKDYMKFYRRTYGIMPSGSIKDQETKYFADNASKIDDLKKEFISNCVSIPPSLKNKVPDLGKQIGKEIAKKIVKEYPKADSTHNSIFSQLGCDDIILLDEKLYQLITIPSFLSKYEKSFEPKFFKDLIKSSENSTPEEVSELISKNKENVNGLALAVIRDKIWCNDKSLKIFLDGKYLIPDYKGHSDKLSDSYMLMIERQVKLDATQDFQKGGLI